MNFDETSYNEFIRCDDDSKFVIIDFDKIFGEEDISHMNTFSLKKRSYYTINSLIRDSITRIFNSCNEHAILPYLQIDYKIKNTDKAYSKEELTSDIIDVINNKHVRKFIIGYVTREYAGGLDEKTEETKKRTKINQELQFTDEHVRILLQASESIRYSIPLIGDFCEHRTYVNEKGEIRKYDINDLLYDIFEKIIHLYQGNVDMMNKIHRFVYSRVVSTQYSDRTIWNLLSNKSKNVDIITLEFLKDIIIGILPKTVNEKNIINLFHVVIRRKITFEFSKNHKISFKPINPNQVDGEGLTLFDKWESSMTKRDESKIIINQLSIKYEIRNIQSIFNIRISNEEFEYYKNRIQINNFQTNILFLFFAKYMSSYNTLYNCTRDEYIYLLIILYKYLKQNEFSLLAEYLIGLPDKLNEKRITTKNSKLFEKISESRIYKDLIRRKYAYISQNIIDSKLIIKLVGNISVSKYLQLVSYEDYSKDKEKYTEDNEPDEIICKVDEFADELLNFIKMI